MKTIEEVKSAFAQRFKLNKVSKGARLEIVAADNIVDMAEAIATWFLDLWEAKVIDTPFLEQNFPQYALNHAHIFTKGIHEVKHYDHFVCGSASVIVTKTISPLRVYTFDDVIVHGSDAEFFAYDSSHVIVGGKSTVSLYNYATVDAGGNSIVYDYTGKNRSVVNKGVIFDQKSNRIYLAKGEYSIVEVS